MLMAHRFVPMPMRVWLAHCAVVIMLMMLIVYMGVLVLQWVVDMGMFVAFADVEINAQSHKERGKAKLQCNGIAEEGDRQKCAHEGRDGEVGACARSAHMAKRQYEQNQAHAIAQQADDAGCGGNRPRREIAPHRERQHEIGCAGNDALERRYLHRIGV